LVYVPPPNEDARKEILRINIVKGKMPVEKEVNIEKLSKETKVLYNFLSLILRDILEQKYV